MIIRLFSLSLVSAACLVGLTHTAAAGPCSDGIADLGRKLAQSPALGPTTTGTLTGSNPGSAPAGSPQPGAAGTGGTSADNRVGGTAGTKELNAASAQIATSPDDVRRQSQGLPTAAQVAASGSGRQVETAPSQAQSASNSAKPDDRMSQAKMELERARMLDQSNDGACRGALDKAREMAG